MTVRYITFTGRMVLAILDGTKTVTRRVMTPQPPSEREALDNGCQEFSFGPAVSKEIKVFSSNHYDRLPKEPGEFDVFGSVGFVRDRCGQTTWRSPYGAPGGILIVREAWHAWFDHNGAERSWHDTPREHRTHERLVRIAYQASEPEAASRWVTPRFMPRWASRAARRLLGIRPERLHEIDNADAAREGIVTGREGNAGGRVEYHRLWQVINGERYPWVRNPYVWRAEFAPEPIDLSTLPVKRSGTRSVTTP